MNYNQLLAQMNTESSPEIRDNIVSFLRHCSSELKTSPNHTIEIAYSIAGLMATDYMRALPNSDPINPILTIAGELETNPEDKDILRDELITHIEKL